MHNNKFGQQQIEARQEGIALLKKLHTICFCSPASRINIMFAFLYSAKQCGPGFGVRVGGRRDACEHIAEECGCGLLPKAYAILMFPWVREGKMRLDSWGHVRTQMQCEDKVICHGVHTLFCICVFTFPPVSIQFLCAPI